MKSLVLYYILLPLMSGDTKRPLTSTYSDVYIQYVPLVFSNNPMYSVSLLIVNDFSVSYTGFPAVHYSMSPSVWQGFYHCRSFEVMDVVLLSARRRDAVSHL